MPVTVVMARNDLANVSGKEDIKSKPLGSKSSQDLGSVRNEHADNKLLVIEWLEGARYHSKH